MTVGAAMSDYDDTAATHNFSEAQPGMQFGGRRKSVDGRDSGTLDSTLKQSFDNLSQRVFDQRMDKRDIV